jgi:rare lipoprotein A
MIFFRLFLAVALSCAPSLAFAETCIASHYGVGDGYGGRRTASGEIMNPLAMTAAHKTGLSARMSS